MFSFIKNTLQKIYNSVTSPLTTLFARPVDEQALKELETILLRADTGITTTRLIIDKIRNAQKNGTIKEGHDLKAFLQHELTEVLQSHQYKPKGSMYMLVGINGSGKTTAAAKLASLYKHQNEALDGLKAVVSREIPPKPLNPPTPGLSIGYSATENKRILFIAADTFRAAATHQLAQWAKIISADIVIGKEGQDPASLIFTGIQKYKQENYDVLIIDTAGRLQTKINLMKELEKINRVIHAQLPDQSVTTLLTIDAMLGQNSFTQAKLFHESTPLDGIILTKMDGTGKGGILFSIAHELKIPIAYISYGEKPEQFALFDAQEYVKQLLDE